MAGKTKTYFRPVLAACAAMMAFSVMPASAEGTNYFYPVAETETEANADGAEAYQEITVTLQEIVDANTGIEKNSG